MLGLGRGSEGAAGRALLGQGATFARPRPRRVVPDVPRDLETIVRKAVAKEPGRRYQTAAELADDLNRFLENRPIKARLVGVLERGWLWCRRKPAMAGLVPLARPPLTPARL